MKIVVLADKNLKEELLAQGQKEAVQIEWPNTIDEFAEHSNADAYIDLLFENKKERIEKLKKLQSAQIFINSVITTLNDLPVNFVRINGWPTFLKRQVMEAACLDNIIKEKAEKVFSCFHKKTEWVPDIAGLISARVVTMIINEAYFALDEGVSTTNEIDTAMKLGTNYPYGPFEWSEKIGIKNIYELLTELQKINSRYEPAPLLQKKASV